MIPRFGGDYLSDVPRGIRIYRARLPHTDRKFLREVRRTGVEVEAVTINPIGVARAWRVLDRRVPDLSGTRRSHIYAYAYMMARYMRETGPDLVVSLPCYAPQWWCPPCRCSIRATPNPSPLC